MKARTRVPYLVYTPEFPKNSPAIIHAKSSIEARNTHSIITNVHPLDIVAIREDLLSQKERARFAEVLGLAGR